MTTKNGKRGGGAPGEEGRGVGVADRAIPNAYGARYAGISATNDFLERKEMEGVGKGTRDALPEERDCVSRIRLGRKEEGKCREEAGAAGVCSTFKQDRGSNRAGGWRGERCGYPEGRTMEVERLDEMRQGEYGGLRMVV